MLKNQIILLLLLLCVAPNKTLAQEITIFKIADFDLTGLVKSCLVSTDYGKEEYRFDESRRLIEVVTRYNANDYDITIYKYANSELLEKRFESYREQALDKATSIAHFYTYDSTKNRKITEKVITYEKEFLEQYEYNYTADKKLSKIVRSNNTGIDETSLVYYKDEEGAGVKYVLNREIQKSVKTKIKPVSDSTFTKLIITKKFLDGKPNTAVETVYNTNNTISSETQFSYDESVDQFIPEKKTLNIYDINNTLLKTEIQAGKTTTTKAFIYQYDLMGNWIKQIITPENSYKTRKIDYYNATEAVNTEE